MQTERNFKETENVGMRNFLNPIINILQGQNIAHMKQEQEAFKNIQVRDTWAAQLSV